MKCLSEIEFDKLIDLSDTNPREALRILSIYEQEYATDNNLQENLGGFLIDIGSALRDMTAIQRGIDNIEQKRRRENGSLSCTQWYNQR